MQNDVIQLRVDSDTVTYYVNQTCLGVAFKDPKINQDGVFPFVFLHSNEDKIEVLPGSLI